ncbi:hypothetical protein TNCV_4747121 [Trichonephila clavipes]|nr:hypothetical protein TNCV_4747121 [Trichonephila clavipes]
MSAEVTAARCGLKYKQHADEQQNPFVYVSMHQFLKTTPGKKSNGWRSGDRSGHRNRLSCLMQLLGYAVSNQLRTEAQRCA